ncbi:hypothetical protein HMPREF1617_00791 [Escherichia coli 908675]|nr:hypothetical protein HMPREF1604_04754 [Escherichia coli 908519]ESE21301.1 hypothetical protein HMPREF1617_00791 [Escherichia coli 908675]ESE27448.1 hypothetical protein HMPREF1622_05036 [Escherichia coli A35218R]
MLRSCRMRRERLIRPTNRANSIDCRDNVGLISVAHQAALRLSSVSD